MSAELLSTSASWAAALLMIGVVAAAVGAVTTRSLFSMCLFLIVASALGACALLALGASDAALGLALVGVGLAPAILFASLLLSARAAKPRRRGRPWLTIAAACAAAGAVLLVTPDLEPAPAAPIANGDVAVWLAPLLFVAACACVGLLGFGERGALARPQHFEPSE